MESPRPSTSSDSRRLSDVSFSRPDSPVHRPSDSFVESQQCSADPNAFLGFHVPPSAEEVALAPVKEKKQTLKLVLDLDATSDVTRGSDGFRPAAHLSANPFNELFAEDTQMDENVMPQKKKEKTQKSSPFKKRNPEQFERRNRTPSPPPTMLKAVEAAWRARKDKMASKQQEEAEDSVAAYSGYSEDLAPRIFQPTLEKSSGTEEKNAAEEKENVEKSIIEDSETDYEDEMECTQQLEEADDGGDRTQSYGADEEAETEVYPFSETGTLPYGACSSTVEEDDSEEKSKDVAQDAVEMDSVIAPTPDEKRSCEDEATSREGSQGTHSQQNYLTPRVNPIRVDKSDSEEKNATLVVRDEIKDVAGALNDEEQEDCVPTQRSKTGTEGEPVVEPNSPSRNNDDLLAEKPVATAADSQTKAIRSLEFSFSMPSQDGEPHFSASLTSEGTPATKRIETFSKSDRPSPFESSISPVYLATPTPTPTPTPADNPTVLESSTTTTDTQVSSKRKNTPSPDLRTGKKKQKTSSKENLPDLSVSTPTAKKRRREFVSPDGNVPSKDDGGDPQTPRPPARRSTRSTQSTPTSTPQVRTRTRTLTPVPSLRTYGSRSRTLFKYKFEFCLTGFVKTGEETLKELIEGHGGKIPERYQDVLYRNNSKAVVIATPVSWRKRKFMQAVACGIPVVHTDWIKDCIDAGYVVPFDGYQVPTGYSVTTRKFECFPPRELHIFEGYSFGIVSDVSRISKSEAKDKSNLMAFILKTCGADAVYENFSSKSGVSVDVVLCDEYTPTCRYYKRKRRIPTKDFQWVTECMILQKFLDPEEPVFEPHRVGSEDVFAASAEIGDSDNTRLKLHTGELVMADISGSAADHYLLFNVCEILSINVSGRKDEGSQSKRKDSKENQVMLRVGMLKREPYNPELSKTPVKVLDISSSQVKRRVVAISKGDYGELKYKDESIFYLEDDGKSDKSDSLAVSEHRWLTQ